MLAVVMAGMVAYEVVVSVVVMLAGGRDGGVGWRGGRGGGV